MDGPFDNENTLVAHQFLRELGFIKAFVHVYTCTSGKYCCSSSSPKHRSSTVTTPEPNTTSSPGTTPEAFTGTTTEPSTVTTPEPNTTSSPGTTPEAFTGTTTEPSTVTTPEPNTTSSPGTTPEAFTGTTTEPSTVTTSEASSTTGTTSGSSNDRYCACDVDEFGMAKEWAEQMWMDIVIILDTSAAMGQSAVTEITSVIESFIFRMNLNDFSTPKYSRISLITASQWPKIHYFFNMPSDADLSNIKAEPFLEFNVVEAIKAAQYLFNFWTPADLHRAQVPRVIYLITNSRPSARIPAADQFKQDGGTIIVNDFVQEGAVAQPQLANLASPGYFFEDLTLDYSQNLVVFCGLNCFCPPSMHSGSNRGGMEPTLGCFKPASEPASFDRAVLNCANARMDLATISNKDEEDFLVRVKGLPHWFGLRHEYNGFRWTDQDEHKYSNWATQEPELENNQSCAYALKGTAKRIEWFTGHCHLPLYYSCTSAPCSAENYCSDEELAKSRSLTSRE